VWDRWWDRLTKAPIEPSNMPILAKLTWEWLEERAWVVWRGRSSERRGCECESV